MIRRDGGRYNRFSNWETDAWALGGGACAEIRRDGGRHNPFFRDGHARDS
jgi:hypothetical protein